MSTIASVWILGDQLVCQHPALLYACERHAAADIRVVLVQSSGRARRLPYQRKKLVLLFSAMRHYAERLRADGYQVDYVQAETFTAGLRQHVTTHQPAILYCMEAAEYAGRHMQHEQLAQRLGIPVEVLPNRMFLVHDFDPTHKARKQPTRTIMEHFYRDMRRHYRILMDGSGPVGGTWNYDHQNRKPLPRTVQPPDIVGYAPDAVTRQVMQEVTALPGLVGTTDDFALAVTHADAADALHRFIAERLPDFGPYEDAMSSRHPTLYHSMLSAYVNIGLLSPMQMIEAAVDAFEGGAAPLNSVEGFVRQILGWREFMYRQYWEMMPDLRDANAWEAHRPMPDAFWTGDTEMHCVRDVVHKLIATGYTHHIERLMIVTNFCLMAGVQPAVVADWFLAFYIDAYDWVVLPNVIGMGLNADGGRIATKPYIASANYINTMSDYCPSCAYHPKMRTGEQACPFNLLYWNFLIQHEQRLRRNPRLGNNVLGLRHLDEAERAAVQQQAAAFLDALEYYEN